MRERGQIIFIGGFRFPEGDAAAVRTMSLARICRDLGFKATVIGKGHVRAEDYVANLDGYYVEGIRYMTMNPAPVTALERLRHPVRRIRLFESTLEAMNLADVKAIVINACDSAMHVPFVAAFCRRKSIPLIGDVVEWYDPCQFKYGRLDPAYAIFRLVFRFYIPRLRNIIAISRYLERHFSGRRRHTIRVTALMDVGQIPFRDRTPNDRVVFLYAGTPGRKDLLREMFVALASLSPVERSRIEFRLIGPTTKELVSLLGKDAPLLELLGETVKIVGRIPRERVLEVLQEAHFTVLLRPDKRYANAGFPSKVAESLAAGTPVFLNFTSDLEEYLGDGTAVVAVHGTAPQDVADAMRRALALTAEELAQLRRGARRKAEQFFHYAVFEESFDDFLEHLR